MKKVVLVGVMFLMFIGVVSASSINGEYKGNPIVKIFSSSTEVKPDDVPALIYNGRTVVPISMLKKLGVGVTWNQSDYSVSVELPKMDNSKLELAKEYAYLMDYYSALQRLKDRINVLDANLIIGINYVGQNYEVADNIKFAKDSVDDSVTEYQRLYDIKDSIISRAYYYGITDANIEIILQSYKSSINAYKLCLEKISNYKTNSNAVTEFNEQEKNGRLFSSTASDLAYETYVEYYQNMSVITGESPTQNYTPQATPKPTATPSPTNKPTPTPTPNTGVTKEYMLLYSNDGKTYLGKLTSNKYDADSIFNDYGSYGGKYSAKSIYNEYGTYGGDYSNESAFNKYASKPPMILLNGKIQGYLTINSYTTGAVSPLGLKEFLISLGY